MHGLRCDVRCQCGLVAESKPQHSASVRKEEDVTYSWSFACARSVYLLVLLFYSIPRSFLLCFTIPNSDMFPSAFQRA